MAADEPTIGDTAPAALGRVPLLAHLPDDRLATLAARAAERRLRTGEWLFHQGDDPDALYVVASGRLAVVDEQHGTALREAEAGDAVGELGIVDGAPRAAGVRAVRDSALWAVPAEAFRELLADDAAVQRALLASLTEMVRSTGRGGPERRPRVIAVIGETPIAAADEVADALAYDLDGHGSVAVLRPEGHTPDGDHHRAGLAAAWGARLDRAERAHRWVLLVAGRDAGPGWRGFASSQADRVVVLADGDDPPPWTAELPDRPRHLVVVDPAAPPAWWDVVAPRSHHHTGPRPDAGSLAALARRLDGRSLGLVLAGGGARGLAHFGVYAELVAAGVTLDRFGGTSAGALAGAIFALGLDPDDALEAARRHVVAARPLSDYTLPAVSLVKGSRLERTGRRFFGDTRIEDLPKGFFSVAADLLSGDQVVHDRGSLWEAVRASISIPGLMPPVERGERLLVDGGLLNNLPADVMTADPDGEAICVDLRRRYRPGRGLGFGPLQPPAVVRRFITGTDASLPNLQDTLMRTVDLAASGGSLTGLPRVAAVVRPDVSDVGLLGWNQIDVAVAAGRAAARRTLEEHPELAG